MRGIRSLLFSLAGAVVLDRFPRLEGRAPPLFEFFGSAVAPVGAPLLQEFFTVLPVYIKTLTLKVGPLVVVESQPLHPVEDRLHRLLGGAGNIGILDPQNELTVVMSREEPVEERRPYPADMEVTGGTRGKAGLHCCVRTIHWINIPAYPTT